MGTYQHAVQVEAQTAGEELSSLDQRILDCAREYLSRQDRLSHPGGHFDSAKRFSLNEKFSCCEDIRSPSRRFPYPEMMHGRSLLHVAHEFGVEQHLKLIRQAANRLKKNGLADMAVFLTSSKAKRMMLEADLNM